MERPIKRAKLRESSYWDWLPAEIQEKILHDKYLSEWRVKIKDVNADISRLSIACENKDGITRTVWIKSGKCKDVNYIDTGWRTWSARYEEVHYHKWYGYGTNTYCKKCRLFHYKLSPYTIKDLVRLDAQGY